MQEGVTFELHLEGEGIPGRAQTVSTQAMKCDMMGSPNTLAWLVGRSAGLKVTGRRRGDCCALQRSLSLIPQDEQSAVEAELVDVGKGLLKIKTTQRELPGYENTLSRKKDGEVL